LQKQLQQLLANLLVKLIMTPLLLQHPAQPASSAERAAVFYLASAGIPPEQLLAQLPLQLVLLLLMMILCDLALASQAWEGLLVQPA